MIIHIVGDRSAIHWELNMSLSVCVCMCVHPVTDVLRDAAVRVQDTQYVADDVSKLSL